MVRQGVPSRAQRKGHRRAQEIRCDDETRWRTTRTDLPEPTEAKGQLGIEGLEASGRKGLFPRRFGPKPSEIGRTKSESFNPLALIAQQ